MSIDDMTDEALEAELEKRRLARLAKAVEDAVAASPLVALVEAHRKQNLAQPLREGSLPFLEMLGNAYMTAVSITQPGFTGGRIRLKLAASFVSHWGKREHHITMDIEEIGPVDYTEFYKS